MIASTVAPRRVEKTSDGWASVDWEPETRIDAPRRAIDYIDHPSFANPALRLLGLEDACDRLESDQPFAGVRTDFADGVAPTKLSHRLPAHLDRMCSSHILTSAEERSLFRRMNYLKFRAADQLSESATRRGHEGRPKSRQRRRESVDSILQRADEVRNQIVHANVRLVVSIVKQFGDGRCSFDELLSEGIHCLIKAVEKFDFDRGFRFSTYATRAIRRELIRLIRRARREEQRWTTGRSELLDQEWDHAEEPATPDRCWTTTSRLLDEFIGQLGEREQFIVMARYGFSDIGEKPTFQRLGELLGISKERVRQLEMRAVKRLRTMSETAAGE